MMMIRAILYFLDKVILSLLEKNNSFFELDKLAIFKYFATKAAIYKTNSNYLFFTYNKYTISIHSNLQYATIKTTSDNDILCILDNEVDVAALIKFLWKRASNNVRFV